MSNKRSFDYDPTVSVGRLSRVAQDYLKAISNATEWSDEPVTTKRLAERLGVSPSTVSETITRLAHQNLVEHEPYGAIELTASGRQLALAMVRRHRLIETLLVSEFSYGWDEVHAEAEVLEHAVSDLLVDRIDARLGYPTRDPHGDRIPTADGRVNAEPARRLSDLPVGQSARIVRISDEDADMLRYFSAVGVTLDAHVTVLDRRAYAGVTSIRSAGRGEEIPLGEIAARAIWVADESIR